MSERFRNLLQLRYDVAKDLYHQAAQARYAESAGLESLVYKVFGADNLGSLTLALDPYWQFTLSHIDAPGVPGNDLLESIFPVSVTQANRERKLASILSYPIYIDYRSDQRTWATGIVPDGPGWRQYYDNPSPPYVISGHYHLGDQMAVTGFIKDTTMKSRGQVTKKKGKKKGLSKLKAFTQGECEMFVPQIRDQSDKFLHGQSSHVDLKWDHGIVDPYGNPYKLGLRQETYISSRLEGPSVTVEPGSMASIASSLQAFCLDQFTSNVDTMFASCLPSRRPFNLIEQIGELKDLPSDVKGLTLLWRDVEKVVGRSTFKQMQVGPKAWKPDLIKKSQASLARAGVLVQTDMKASEAFLAFKFGWSPFLKFLNQLVYSPAKISKSVNYLIDRNGKNTSLSATRRWHQTPAFSPGATVMDLGWYDSQTPTELLTSDMSVVIRCVVNSGIYFPSIEIPTFRDKLYLEAVGLYPSPADIYDLMPWSWFVDWFSGLGDYVHLMSQVNGASDESPINYGFMTAHANAVWTYGRSFTRNETYLLGGPGIVNGVDSAIHETEIHRYMLTGTVAVKYYLRRSLENIFAVPTYAGLNLSEGQQSILSALFAQYLGGQHH